MNREWANCIGLVLSDGRRATFVSLAALVEHIRRLEERVKQLEEERLAREGRVRELEGRPRIRHINGDPRDNDLGNLTVET